jgi:hypothetical protein
MSVLSASLFPGGICFNGNNWIGELTSLEFKRVVRGDPRVEAKPSGGKPWRNILVYDELGLYALEDIETDHILDVCFALVPERTPFTPKNAFAGIITLNGVPLKAGMKLRELPLSGEINFVPGIGSTWKYMHDHGYVELDLRKTPGSKNTPVLVSITHSFLGE